jgi:hypothetical protein
VEESSRAFDVGEEEGDSAGREIAAHAQEVSREAPESPSGPA